MSSEDALALPPIGGYEVMKWVSPDGEIALEFRTDDGARYLAFGHSIDEAYFALMDMFVAYDIPRQDNT